MVEKSGDPFHPHKQVEQNMVNTIDNHLKSQIFSRDDKSPNSLNSYWASITSAEGIPSKKEEQIDYFLSQMDTVKLDGYRLDKLSKDKMYVENSIGIDFDEKRENPTRHKEKLLGKVYAYCLGKVFFKKDVISGGNSEEISLTKITPTHPYDSNKRRVEQVLSIEDTRYPGQVFNLGLGVQWGHEGTNDETIDARLSYIIDGISDYGSMTEICYSPVSEEQVMPISTPSVIVGGDINKIATFVDQVMKGEYSEAAKNSLVSNAIAQMKTQIDLFYAIAVQQQENYAKATAPTDDYKKMKFMVVKDKLHETVTAYLAMKNVIDQVFEANAYSINHALPDGIHKKMMSVCAEIAKRNNITI